MSWVESLVLAPALLALVNAASKAVLIVASRGRVADAMKSDLRLAVNIRGRIAKGLEKNDDRIVRSAVEELRQRLQQQNTEDSALHRIEIRMLNACLTQSEISRRGKFAARMLDPVVREAEQTKLEAHA